MAALDEHPADCPIDHLAVLHRWQEVSVYVDDMRAPFGRMVMCHMLADSTDELLAMADLIGVSRRWLQHAGTSKEHFDIALSKRTLAIQHGAIEITRRETAEHLRVRR